MKKMLAFCLSLVLLLTCISFAGAEETVTLTVMNVQSSEDATYNAAVAQFEAENPHIKIEHISTVNAELKKQVRIAMLAGNMPDVIMFDNPDYASFAASGYLMDITDLVSGWTEMPTYYNATLSAVTYKDRLYGLPFESNSLGLWYNKTMLDSLGLDVPTTWDDVLAICVAAKAQGNYGLAIAAPQSEVATFQFIPWLYAAGGSIEKLDTPEAAKALSFLADLVKEGYMSKEVLGYSHGDLMKAFQGGNVALMVNGSWNIANLAENTSFEYGATTMPVVTEGDTPATCLGGYHIGITADCKNVDAAVKYLKFMSSAESNLTWCIDKGLLPTNAETAANAAFTEPPLSMFVAGLPGAIARVNPFWPDLSVNVYTAIQSALSGEQSAEDALAGAEALNAAYWQY
ncbi:MAG: sugar ABC transporter substrate-binding protein [Eubacteriales bacterium]|nr:sugar ABC transporter substrate-binding protein [Eubacteriales bacterium]